jgi:hypothetical protein
MATRIRIKRGTESQITGYTGPHFEGELAYATNTGNVFVSDGTAFISIGGGETPTLQSVTDEGNTTTNNIGIGTTAPSALLEISGGGTTTDFLKLTTTAGGATPVKLIFEKSAAEQGIIEFNRNGDLEIYNTDNDGGVLISGSGSATADMYINHSGNVGIGTTAPDEKLRVQGNIKSAGDFIGSAVKLGFAGTANITTYDTNEDLLINPNGSGDILMQTASTGNVGIGTTAPTEKLEVVGKAIIRKSGTATPHGDTDFLVTDSTAALSTAQMQILSGNNASSILYFSDTDAYNVGGIKYGHSDNSMRLQVNSSERVIITDTGNVGIGTTAPSEKLEVAGNIISTWNNNRFIGIQFEDGDAFKNGLVLKAGDRSTGLISKASNNNPYIWFGTGSEPVTERMRITSTGNVGIGTTAPAAKLHVAGEIRLNAGQPLMLDVANNIYAVAAQNQFRLYINSNPAINVTTSGNVGIGTTAPNSKVHINGTAMSQFRLEVPGGPSSNTDTAGREGDFAYDDQYLYIKTGSGWGRVPLDFGF